MIVKCCLNFRFECVVNRPGLRSTFSDKYLAVFSNFEDVLEEVQNLYETQKVPSLCEEKVLQPAKYFDTNVC